MLGLGSGIGAGVGAGVGVAVGVRVEVGVGVGVESGHKVALSPNQSPSLQFPDESLPVRVFCPGGYCVHRIENSF